MTTQLTEKQIAETIAFHGHSCPGLAIGMRVAAWALEEFGRAGDEEIVAVVETDMCGVDAIQYLVGCTFGKGNLIHRDYGKSAFTFYRRSDGKALRLVARSLNKPGETQRIGALYRKKQEKGLTPEEEAQLVRSRKEKIAHVMEADMDDLFSVLKPLEPQPAKARILDSVVCSRCGELTMASRTRQRQGEVLCIPCAAAGGE